MPNGSGNSGKILASVFCTEIVKRAKQNGSCAIFRLAGEWGDRFLLFLNVRVGGESIEENEHRLCEILVFSVAWTVNGLIRLSLQWCLRFSSVSLTPTRAFLCFIIICFDPSLFAAHVFPGESVSIGVFFDSFAFRFVTFALRLTRSNAFNLD